MTGMTQNTNSPQPLRSGGCEAGCGTQCPQCKYNNKSKVVEYAHNRCNRPMAAAKKWLFTKCHILLYSV